MAFQTVFKRYEIKFMLTLEQKQLLLPEIEKYMCLDRYGRTLIKNLYLDTPSYRLARRSIELKPVLEVSRTDIITTLLEAGQHVSFLPDFVTRRKVAEGKLAYLEVKDVSFDIWQQLIYHRGKWISRALETFIQYVSKMEFNR